MLIIIFLMIDINGVLIPSFLYLNFGILLQANNELGFIVKNEILVTYVNGITFPKIYIILYFLKTICQRKENTEFGL